MVTLLPTGLAVLSFLFFFIAFRRNKARLFTGFLFCVFVVLAGAALVLAMVWANSPILNAALIFGASIAAVILFFGVYILLAALFLNARLMRKRERHSLANSLTLLLAVGLLAFLVVSGLMGGGGMPVWLQALWSGALFAFAFYFLNIFVFLASALVCNMARPRKNQHYIIVLGARIQGNRPAPLLAARLDKAIAFYKKQAEKAAPPKLVLSGGHGEDEELSEAEAMRLYALEKGIPEEHILLEDQSANTYQNMEFSKAVIERDYKGSEPVRCIFSTSNYHVLRSAVYARKAGLPIDGIGSKTALYYLPNALLREYAAFFSMHKKAFILATVALFCLGAALDIFLFLAIKALTGAVVDILTRPFYM